MPTWRWSERTLPSFLAIHFHQPMAVIKEDGGKLNAFAKEPRMEVVDGGRGLSRPSLGLVIGGGLMVALMVALAFKVS